MSLAYFDIEVDSLDKGGRGKILTIQYRYLDDPNAPLVILRAWELGGEKGVVDKFAKDTGFFSKKWGFIPVGWNILFDLSHMWSCGIRYGHIKWGSDPYAKMKPHVDLHQIALLFNADKTERPDNLAYESEIPPMFYGTRMSDWTTKRGGGDIVGDLYRTKQYHLIEKYIRQEEAAFTDLWKLLIRDMPDLWRNHFAPSLGIKTGVNGRGVQPLEAAENPPALR